MNFSDSLGVQFKQVIGLELTVNNHKNHEKKDYIKLNGVICRIGWICDL